MAVTNPGEFSYCYVADTVHASANYDVRPNDELDTTEACFNTSFGGNDVLASVAPKFQHTQTGHTVARVWTDV